MITGAGTILIGKGKETVRSLETRQYWFDFVEGNKNNVVRGESRL